MLTGTSWIDPTTMITVRNDTKKRTGGKIFDFDSVQLVTMKRVPRSGGS